MNEDTILIRAADGREVPLEDATWEDMRGGWEPDGSEELRPPLPIVTVAHEMTQRPGAAAYAGQFYHQDEDGYSKALDVVLVARRRSRALFAQGQDKPVCASHDGEHPDPDARIWQFDYAGFNTTNGTRVDMNAVRGALPEMPACRECPFAGREDERGEYVSGICRASRSYLALRKPQGTLCLLRLTATQSQAIEQFIRQRMRSRERPLISMVLTLTTKRVSTRTGHAYELEVYGADLPVVEAYQLNSELAEERRRFVRMLAAPLADPETGEILE